MVSTANPLIGENKADTIDQIYQLADWLYLSAECDDETHRGMVLQLKMLRDAVGTLRPAPGS